MLIHYIQALCMKKNYLSGEPIFYNGKYETDKIYDLYIQMITCSFELKKDKIPTIQIKNSMSFMDNQYLESSNGEIVALCLTSVDLKLFLEHYNVYDLTYVNGWKFRSISGLFCEYIDKWTKIKIESKANGNSGMYTLAKLMLNSLYGKFALCPDVRSKYPILDENGIVHYKLYEKEVRDGIYLPVRSIYYSLCKRKNNSNIASN